VPTSRTRTSSSSRNPPFAIAHDYLTQRGGAEKVVLAMARAFPDAVIYTTLYDPESTFPEFKDLNVRVGPLNRVALFRRHHRLAMPVLAFVVSLAKPIRADVLLVSSSGWAHGFRTTGSKIVYCYSPARWLYQRDRYLGDSARVSSKMMLALVTPLLRRWDRRAARSADGYIAISNIVRDRIRDTYALDSVVLPAPCTIETHLPKEPVKISAVSAEAGFYLCVSRLLPYKNVDQIIHSFVGSSRTLVIVGSGPDERLLQEIADDNIVMLKNLTDEQMRWLYSECRAVVAASYEDFGLTPLEAAAYGKPSAVLRWGGFLDTMVEGTTGVYFDEPEPKAIRRAIDKLELASWDAEVIRDHEAQFEEPEFAAGLRRTLLAFGADSAIRGNVGVDPDAKNVVP
jgi:glycosyltransferase involved in cell wall biosynthesis